MNYVYVAKFINLMMIASGVSLGREMRVFQSKHELVRMVKLANSAVLVDPKPYPATLNFTFCIRYRPYILHDQYLYTSNPGTHAQGSNFLPDALGFIYLMADHAFVGLGTYSFLVKMSSLPLVWNSFCYSHDQQSGRIVAVFEGRATNLDAEANIPHLDRMADFLRLLRVGTNRDSKTARYFTGEITDVNVWSEPTSVAEMIDWTSCESSREGDQVGWSNSSWELKNFRAKVVDGATLCDRFSFHMLIVLPIKMTYLDGSQTCIAFGGSFSAPRSEEENGNVTKLFPGFESCGSEMWIGFNDIAVEDRWVEKDTGRELNPGSFTSWYAGEPNGYTYENCAIISRAGTWNDFSCDQKLCTPCKFTKIQSYTLRGFGPDSHFDIRYNYIGWKNGQPSFRGFETTNLYWNEKEMQWRLESIWNASIFGSYNVSDSYPLGARLWHFPHGAYRHSRSPSSVELLLSACSRSEFPCRNGRCIHYDDRCNNVDDCGDSSDEKNCKLLDPGPSYSRDFCAPSTADGNETEIRVEIDISQVLYLSEVKMSFKVQYEFRMTWIESRLKYFNLKEDHRLNTLRSKEKFDVWVPKLVMENTDRKETTRLTDDTIIYVRREGPHTLDVPSRIESNRVFDGTDNSLTYVHTYDTEFHCLFKLHNYPFDKQTCTMTFSVTGSHDDRIDLVPRRVKFLGSRYLIQYHVRNVSMTARRSGGKSVLEVEIMFHRICNFHLATTYLPTSMLFVITYFSNYFSDEFFDASIMVSLTTMLVMTTIFLNVNSSLPSTAYVKMIDIWIIFGFFYPFCVMTINFLIHCKQREQNKVQPEINSKSGIKDKISELITIRRLKIANYIILPVIGLNSVIIYSVIASWHYFS